MEWKAGLPATALAKVDELERRVEQLQRDSQSKSLQVENLQSSHLKFKTQLQDAERRVRISCRAGHSPSHTIAHHHQHTHMHTLPLTLHLKCRGHALLSPP
jgi:multidrug resistance efflux pump